MEPYWVKKYEAHGFFSVTNGNSLDIPIAKIYVLEI